MQVFKNFIFLVKKYDSIFLYDFFTYFCTAIQGTIAQ